MDWWSFFYDSLLDSSSEFKSEISLAKARSVHDCRMDRGNRNKEKACEVAGWSCDISLNKIEGHKKLMRDYFLSSCIFPFVFLALLPHDRMTVLSDMEANKPFFQQRGKDVCVLGFLLLGHQGTSDD